MMPKIVAIHQPNFFPWLGYFDKIIRADIFIALDNVQFPKKGGTYCNRVKIVNQGQAAWMTMPVVRAYHGMKEIREIRINHNTSWQVNLLRTLQLNYTKAPYFDEVFPVLKEVIQNPTDSLVEYNLTALHQFMKYLKLDTSKMFKSSTLDADGQATDLLIALTKAVGGTAYLCGGGAGGYQEDEKFLTAGLKLIYQEFRHPVYPQAGVKDFLPGLSIIDMLMNCGFDAATVTLSPGV